MSNHRNNKDDVLQAFRLVVGDTEREKLSEWIARYPELHHELVQIAIEWYRLQAKMDSSGFPPENRNFAERLINAATEPIQSSPKGSGKIPERRSYDLLHKIWRVPAKLESRLSIVKEIKWRSP